MNQNPLTGMDSAQSGSLASRMIAEAVALELILAPVTQKLEAAPWRGRDRDQFVQEWKTQHVAPLAEVTESLREAAQQARRHVANQERASGGY